MRKITTAKHTIEIYDAIDELPIVRFHKYNKMLLIDAGIGSDIADVDTHLFKAMQYIQSKTPDLAMAELQNMRQCLYMIQSGLSPKHMAFACLVKTIDGKECNDISDEGIKATLDKINDIPHKEITAHTEAVKKKIDKELKTYFPKVFDDATEKEYYDRLKARTLAVLNSIINDEENEYNEVIRKIDGELLSYSKPKCFTGADNIEVAHDISFEKMCVTLSQYLHVNAKEYSVMEFYSAYAYLTEYLKAKAKAMKGK